MAKQRERLESQLGQTLPAKLTDCTCPSAGPYVQRFDALIRSGAITSPALASLQQPLADTARAGRSI